MNFDRDEQLMESSIAEGKRLAGMYKDNPNEQVVDKIVHDALLEDAYEDRHSRLSLKQVRKTLAEETKKLGDPNVKIESGDFESHRKWTLPGLSIEMEGSKLYDIVEAGKFIEEKEKKVAAASEEGKKAEALPPWDLRNWGNIPALFNDMSKATEKR